MTDTKEKFFVFLTQDLAEEMDELQITEFDSQEEAETFVKDIFLDCVENDQPLPNDAEISIVFGKRMLMDIKPQVALTIE
jgi:hypothetical protein